ncbi:hypothetical protein [Streptobacillus ratti]|uniref:hypothetical protein n=1 Tax=Streptobacillus ratti TaxID=1720557 RepID=UPI000932BB24|nr:hypothetical protein [Streptobacillus ratti]
MNKVVFGFLALTTIASFSSTSGNFEVEGNVKFGKGVNVGLDKKVKLGIYLDSRKDLYGFSHSVVKTDDALKVENLNFKYLVGLSFQKKLGDKTDIGVYGAYKHLLKIDAKEDESFKDELVKHLSSKNKYRDDFNFFQKTDTLNRLGYKSEEKKNIIVGIHGNTRIKRTDIYASGSYVTDRFKKNTDRLYTYFETNTMLDLGFFNTKFVYDLNSEEQQKTKVIHKNSKDETINVAKNGGALNIDLKFSSSRILPDTFFYNQVKLDLKSGFKATDKGERFLEFEQKNYFKYTGIKNLTVVGKLDYELKHSVYDKTSTKPGNGSSNTTNIMTENKHTVRITGNGDYVVDKYRLFGEFSTSNSISMSKSNFINHTYDLKGIFEYNLLNNFKLITDASYKTYITAFSNNSDATLRMGYKSSGRKGRMIYDSKSNVAYRMFGLSKNDVTNSIFSLSENKLSYLSRGFKVEANLNIASEYEMVTKEQKADKKKASLESEAMPQAAAKAAKPKTSKPKAAKPSKPTTPTINKSNNLLLFVNPGFKMSYKKGKVYLGTDVQFVYSKDIFESNNKNKYGLMSKNEIKYSVKDNVTLLLGVDLDYRENKLSFDHMKNFTDYVDNLGFNQYKYYKYRTTDKSSTKYEYNDAKKLKVEDQPKKDREVKAKVSLGTEFKLVENRLTFKPTTSFTYVYEKDSSSSVENKYIGNVGLNISYNW